MTNLSEPGRSNPQVRLHALDALRAGALLLGLLVHSAMAFMAGTENAWIVHDKGSSPLADLAFFVPHMFRMVLFFMIAGLFARLGIQQLGRRAFVKDRIKRIVLVFIGFWPVIMAGIIATAIVAQATGFAVPPPPKAGGVPLFHLWFLYVLTLFYAATLAGTALRLIKVDPAESVGGIGERLLASPLAAPVLAIPLAGAMLADPRWLPWFGVPTPDQFGLPGAGALAGYGCAYALGWWLAARLAMLGVWAGRWRLNLGLAVGASAEFLWQFGLKPDFAPLHGPQRILAATSYGLGAWGWTLALTGLAQTYLNRPVREVRYLADASYWIYLLHLPVVMLLQVAVIRSDIPLAIKMEAVVLAATALLLGTYHLLVRRSWIGAWINGRRKG